MTNYYNDLLHICGQRTGTGSVRREHTSKHVEVVVVNDEWHRTTRVRVARVNASSVDSVSHPPTGRPLTLGVDPGVSRLRSAGTGVSVGVTGPRG